jgi:ribosomal protein S18 acetylase RimI-like enzyme
MSLDVQPLRDEDRSWARRLLAARWGSPTIVSRGRAQDASRLAGFVARLDGARAGLATYRIDGDACELVSLDSITENCGVGSALLDAVVSMATEAGCRRLWLITGNDNLNALRFYQKRELRLVALHRDALAESRRIKPEIPERGLHGIPLRDELELERLLS